MTMNKAEFIERFNKINENNRNLLEELDKFEGIGTIEYYSFGITITKHNIKYIICSGVFNKEELSHVLKSANDKYEHDALKYPLVWASELKDYNNEDMVRHFIHTKNKCTLDLVATVKEVEELIARFQV